MLIANPNNVAAPVTLTFSKESGEQFIEDAQRGRAFAQHGARRSDCRTRKWPRRPCACAPTRGVPLLVERTMFWDSRAYAGHTGSAVEQPSTDWYFAEGSQGFFDTFLLVINPNATPTDVTFTYLRENEAPVVQTLTVGPYTRMTVPSVDVEGLRDRSFGISLHATQPITAERAMYFGPATGRHWSGGTESAGVTAPSTKWFLAEGATGSFFTTYVLLSNPNDAPANVTLQYLLDNGQTMTVPKSIAGNARLTVNIGAEDDPRLKNAAVSTVVNSNVPIIAERSMYWTGASSPWGEGHNSFGVVEAGTRWGLAEGRDRRAARISHLHPAGESADQRGERDGDLLPRRRRGGRQDLHGAADQPVQHRYARGRELRGDKFGAMIQVTNDVPIIVERSMYWDTLGYTFSGGTNATGIRMTAQAGDGCANLLADPGFESGVSSFTAQDTSSSVTRSTTSPIDGTGSLRVAMNGFGNNAWWVHEFSGRPRQPLQRERARAIGPAERVGAALLRDGLLRRRLDGAAVHAGLRRGRRQGNGERGDRPRYQQDDCLGAHPAHSGRQRGDRVRARQRVDLSRRDAGSARRWW